MQRLAAARGLINRPGRSGWIVTARSTEPPTPIFGGSGFLASRARLFAKDDIDALAKKAVVHLDLFVHRVQGEEHLLQQDRLGGEDLGVEAVADDVVVNFRAKGEFEVVVRDAAAPAREDFQSF